MDLQLQQHDDLIAITHDTHQALCNKHEELFCASINAYPIILTIQVLYFLYYDVTMGAKFIFCTRQIYVS